MFAFARVKAMAPDYPEWQNKPALKAVMDGDKEALFKAGNKGILEVVMVTHAGMSTGKLEQIVSGWIATAEHPLLKQKYTDLTYQPMKELIGYLQDNDFKTYIVSGGGAEFILTPENQFHDSGRYFCVIAVSFGCASQLDKTSEKGDHSAPVHVP